MRITRTDLVLRPDPSRVLLRPFWPGEGGRVEAILDRVLLLDEAQVAWQLGQISREFSNRHVNLPRLLQARFEDLRARVPGADRLSDNRRALIGAYFFAEYSVESAALFNPALVPAPDQSGLNSGALRFILSLRATGEGHISSITFRAGVIQAGNRIEMSEPPGLLTEPRQIPNPVYEKPLFGRKLQEMSLAGGFTQEVMNALGDTFVLADLRDVLDQRLAAGAILHTDRTAADAIWALARSNFEVQFEPVQDLSERVLFPATPSQRNGIEDARFVRFRDDDGRVTYYATFTAYDGRAIMPELVETTDFLRFRFITLNGPAARNKGMALFPRKIDGRYAMLSRQDGESISLMYSDNVHFWNEHQPLLKPRYPWELVQMGNCGSPLETEDGWLVLSHGVGPMRRYCIGAFLLDRDDPSKVLGRLREPLLEPDQNEREGYVPNVVYSCGGLIHDGVLVLPYGMADHATGFATVPVGDLLAAMVRE